MCYNLILTAVTNSKCQLKNYVFGNVRKYKHDKDFSSLISLQNLVTYVQILPQSKNAVCANMTDASITRQISGQFTSILKRLYVHYV